MMEKKYLCHNAFIVNVEAKLPQTISAKRHLCCLTAFSKKLDKQKERETSINQQGKSNLLNLR